MNPSETGKGMGNRKGFSYSTLGLKRGTESGHHKWLKIGALNSQSISNKKEIQSCKQGMDFKMRQMWEGMFYLIGIY